MHIAFSFGELHLPSHIINLWHSETGEETSRLPRRHPRTCSNVGAKYELQSSYGHAVLDTAAEMHAFRRPEGLTW